MDESEWRRPRRFVTWGTVGLLLLGGASIAAYFIVKAIRPPVGAFYPLPFIHFIFGIFILF